MVAWQQLVNSKYKKAEYVLIGSRQCSNDIQINPKITLSETKTLGIVVDDQLLWKNHLDATIAKVSKRIGILRRMKLTYQNILDQLGFYCSQSDI